MPFCTVCGDEYGAGASFCVRCGTAIANVPAASLPVESGTRRFRFHGTGGRFFTLYAVMILLSMVTASIYSFWGRTNIRRYIARETELDGERFDYHGTGLELLLGWLKAMGLLLALLLVVGIATVTLDEMAGQVAGTLLIYAAFLFLMPLAMVGAWRYRFSRTSYRGLRFSFRGKPAEFVRVYVAGALLSFLTLFLYTPIWQNNIRRFLCENTYYGSARFGYDGSGSALFGRWAVCWLLAVPTLGVSLVWFWVERFRFFWNHTTFQGARLRVDIHTPGMVWLYVSNFLLNIFTLFLAYPWTQVRLLRYVLEKMTLDGAVSYERIRQEALAAGAMGEGFGPWLESSGIDSGIGL